VIRDSKTEQEENDSSMDIYMQYLRYMSRSGPELNEREKFASGYQDFLQSPLQVSTIRKYYVFCHQLIVQR